MWFCILVVIWMCMSHTVVMATDAPTVRPTRAPTYKPTRIPTASPSFRPTREPTAAPSKIPTNAPTPRPSREPTLAPSRIPTAIPTCRPTRDPTVVPTCIPTNEPTMRPSREPTFVPTRIPTNEPTVRPTRDPTGIPSRNPSHGPSARPSNDPTAVPTRLPTASPSLRQTNSPSTNPAAISQTAAPTFKPTETPTGVPSEGPTVQPTTMLPTNVPSEIPNLAPSFVPSILPTGAPTVPPTAAPTAFPTFFPSFAPTLMPTAFPTVSPTGSPTLYPTLTPSAAPTAKPTKKPTRSPTSYPTLMLITPSNQTSLGFSSQVYPSASTSWILSGGWSAATAPTSSNNQLAGLNTSDAVKKWEYTHADMAFGGDYGVAGNKKLVVTGYMYNQMLNFDPSAQEMWMRILSLNESYYSPTMRQVDYEDFFLHFTEDTEFPVKDLTLSSYTSLNGLMWVFGWTNGPTHAGFSVYWGAPWNVKPWQYCQGGGMAYLISFEKFDEIELMLDSSAAGAGGMVIEYVSATQLSTSPKGTVPVKISSLQATKWSRLPLVLDSTFNLSTSGKIRWKPPTNWQLAAYSDGSGRSYGGGQFFGNSLLAAGGVGYAIRIRWTGGAPGPTLNNLNQRRFIRYVNPSGSLQLVAGWDPANDVNGDGYVDDDEYQNLVNPKATARMRHESRAFTVGQMWSARSSGIRVNAWNGDYARYVALWMKKSWTELGLQGAYNDDLLKMLGPNEFPITRGGTIAEYPGKINETSTSLAFQAKFTDILALIKALTKSKWVSGNISGVNLFTSASTRPYITVLDVFLREEYLTAGIGLTGFFGVQKMWDTFAYSAAGKVCVVQGMAWYGAVKLVNGTSRVNWERDLGTLLSSFYLINVPRFTSFQAWGNGYYYGSGNTQSYNYYAAGVPMNVAYQPTNMLKVDIGKPKTSASELIPMLKREFMAYQMTTKVPLNSYTVIGYSNESRVVHPEVSLEGVLPITPSFIYYLQRDNEHPQIKRTPLSCVLAREYTKGLVLYRTDVYGNSVTFLKSSITVNLPSGVNYRRVRFDGTLGPIQSSVTLFGYEGAIFVDASTVPSPAA